MTGRPANPALLGYVEFFLPTGRVVWLSKLRQWRTYRGLRCGYAHHVVNDRCMVEARERALEHFCDTNPTSVLETEIAAYDYPPQGGDRCSGVMPCRPSLLPPFLILNRPFTMKGVTPRRESFGFSWTGKSGRRRMCRAQILVEIDGLEIHCR